MKNFTSYLRPAENTDLKYEMIKRAAGKLTHDCTDEIEKAMRPYCFVRDGIQHSFYTVSIALENFAASTVLAGGKGCSFNSGKNENQHRPSP